MTGTLLTRGTKRGQAAKGEYGNDALLTASGLVVMRDATSGLWVPKYPPGYLLARDNGGAATPLNTTGETTVLNSTMAGALPAFVALGDAVQLRAWGTAVLGATGTLLFNAYGGATKIAAGQASGNYAAGAARGWMLDLWIHLLSSTTVAVSGFMVPRGLTGAGFGAAPDVQVAGNDAGTAVTVSALPLAIDIKAVMSVNTATSQVSCKGAEARYYPKNY